MKGRKPFRIVVAEPFASEAVARLEEVADVTVLGSSSPDAIIEALPEADALLVRAKAHVTARIINAAPKLKVIGRASPTIDHIDLRAARRRDISVVYSPHAAVGSSAEFALGLILAMHRRIVYFDQQVRDGKFETMRQPIGHELRRETIGFLGMDAVAQKLGGILAGAFQPQLLYHDPWGNEPQGFEAEPVSLETLLAKADILSIHLRLNPETRGLVNADRLRLMKATALLVNTSRGAVVETTSLAESLKNGRLAGAALDVFETEPLPANHPIRKAPNCILTPHVAGATVDASEGRFNVADDVVRVLQGEDPLYPVSLPAT